MNAERNQLVEADVLVALFLQLLHPFRSRPMNSHGNEFVRVWLVAGLFEAAHHFRRHPVNAECNQFVAITNAQPRRANRRYELRRHPVNLESNELVRVQPLEVQDRKSTRLNSSHGYISYAV